MKRTKPLARGTPPRKRGGRQFKHGACKPLMDWLKQQLMRGVPCDCGCGRRATVRAHVEPKGSGGRDWENVVLLAQEPCHREQEKRTAAFERDRGLPPSTLQMQAIWWTQEWYRWHGEQLGYCEHGVAPGGCCEPCWIAAEGE